MNREEFFEYFDAHYREMPETFYPEIWSERQETGWYMRRSANGGAYEPRDQEGRTKLDDDLRQWEWRRSEILRIIALAGVE